MKSKTQERAVSEIESILAKAKTEPFFTPSPMKLDILALTDFDGDQDAYVRTKQLIAGRKSSFVNCID